MCDSTRDPQMNPETSNVEVNLPDRRISYSWEVGSAAGVGSSDVVEVPADAANELIDEIVKDAVFSESGFSWGWDDA